MHRPAYKSFSLCRSLRKNTENSMNTAQVITSFNKRAIKAR